MVPWTRLVSITHWKSKHRLQGCMYYISISRCLHGEFVLLDLLESRMWGCFLLKDVLKIRLKLWVLFLFLVGYYSFLIISVCIYSPASSCQSKGEVLSTLYHYHTSHVTSCIRRGWSHHIEVFMMTFLI